MRLLGIDIGGTNIKAGVVDEEGKVLEERVYPCPENLPSLFKTFEQISGELSPFDSVGFGIAGLWDSERKRIRLSPNIPFLKDAEIWGEIQRIFPGARIQNDANVAAFGEMLFGKGREFSTFVYITLGTGIGGGIIVDRRLLTGKSGFAGEVGHMQINPSGRKCGCGSTGCWETEASASALERKYYERTGERLSAKEIGELARKGEKEAASIYQEIAEWLGRGIVSLINIFDPEAIILGGGLAKAGDLLLEPVLLYIKNHSYVYQHSSIEIEISSLGYMAGVIGAAAYGWKGIE